MRLIDRGGGAFVAENAVVHSTLLREAVIGEEIDSPAWTAYWMPRGFQPSSLGGYNS